MLPNEFHFSKEESLRIWAVEEVMQVSDSRPDIEYVIMDAAALEKFVLEGKSD